MEDRRKAWEDGERAESKRKKELEESLASLNSSIDALLKEISAIASEAEADTAEKKQRAYVARKNAERIARRNMNYSIAVVITYFLGTVAFLYFVS